MRIRTGNKTHDDNCLAAEVTRQNAVAAAANQAAVTAADIAFYKTVRDSARANGLTAELGAFNLVIRSLGGSP
jgi:hypothetical protein